MLQLHCTVACRNLKDNPNVAENMAKCAAQREALQGLLGATIDSLELNSTVQPVIEAVLTAEQAEVRRYQHWLGCKHVLHPLLFGFVCMECSEAVMCRSEAAAICNIVVRVWLLLTCLLQADMREMIEAEKSATALVKALKADLASEKQQHEERVR
jgi:hypothetical protein